MENFKLLLPSIIEDYNEISFDGENFIENIEKYKKILNIFYHQETRTLDIGSISSFNKKNMLLSILENNDIDDDIFLSQLQQCIPFGLDMKHICTDEEYNDIKKIFHK